MKFRNADERQFWQRVFTASVERIGPYYVRDIVREADRAVELLRERVGQECVPNDGPFR